ncbi:hypothetical protein RQP46_000629 [Phenoliferia psychrophenolica]
MAAIQARSVQQATSTEDADRRRKVPPHATARPIDTLSGSAPATPQRAGSHAQAFDLAYTSYLLATSPSKVLPPGKTLSEALHARSLPLPPPPPILPHIESPLQLDQRELLEGRLTSFAKALAPSSPALVRTRASNRLKAALGDVALPLLVRERGVTGDDKRLALEKAFQPDPDDTPFSVATATALLHSLATTLADLCSTARDVQTRPLIATLSAPIIPSRVSPTLPVRIPARNLSLTTLLEAFRDLVKLSKDMAADLELFKQTVQNAIDDELMVKIAAWENEKAAIQGAYGDDNAVAESVLRWLARRGGVGARREWQGITAPSAEAEAARGWMVTNAFIETIFAEDAVGFEAEVGMAGSSERKNDLPAIFVVQAPVIFRLQNAVQGLVIVACLASLAGVPAPAPFAPDPLGDAWVLGTGLLDHESDVSTSISAARASATPPAGPLALGELAEGILQIRRGARGQTHNGSSELEDRVVRASVDRIIKSQDPVYRLLRSRLKDAIKAALKAPAVSRSLGVPAKMQSGILGSIPDKKHEKRKLVIQAPKGFTRQPVLGLKLLDLANQIRDVVAWSADVWGEKLAFASTA